MTTSLYYGIDTSKASLQLGSELRSLKSYKNTPSGHQALIGYLRKQDVAAIALEATGIYGSALADALFEAGYRVYVVQPGRIKAFAKSQGIRSKSDPIDAQVIASYAASSHRTLHHYCPTSRQTRALRDLVSRRDQVVDDRTREKTRLEACLSDTIATRIRRNIRSLNKEIEYLDLEIRQKIKESDELNRKAEILRQCKGVGEQTVSYLLAFFPELGTINRQELAALLGMAPFIRESGKWKGKRFIYGGRSRLRKAMYMAALSASRFDPVLKGFYQRLLKKGKEKKLALIAVARKLAIYVNTQIKKLMAEIQPEGLV